MKTIDKHYKTSTTNYDHSKSFPYLQIFRTKRGKKQKEKNSLKHRQQKGKEGNNALWVIKE